MEHHYYYPNYGTQTVLFQNMGHSLIQIMGLYKLLLKLWDTSETLAHTVKVMSISTGTSRVIFPQQKPVKYTKSPIIWCKSLSATEIRSSKFKGYMRFPSTFATTGVSSDNSLSNTRSKCTFSVKLYDFSHSIMGIFMNNCYSHIYIFCYHFSTLIIVIAVKFVF